MIAQGERNSNARLSEEEARRIHEMYRGGVRVGKIAEELRISRKTVGDILYGHRWRHLGIAIVPKTRRAITHWRERNQVREEYQSGLSVRELALKFACSRDVVYRIIKSGKERALDLASATVLCPPLGRDPSVAVNFFAMVRRGKENRFTPAETTPVRHRPGSPEKVAVLAERVARGEALWHEGDCNIFPKGTDDE